MEPAKIDWNRIESVFVEDKLYENINAPKWVDFLSQEDDGDHVDDQSWFCRPDCNHPKTAEDFIKSKPTSKLSISVDKARNPLGQRNQREARLKRRGQIQFSVGSCDKSHFNEDGENQNPNLVTPPNRQANFMKAMMKSSAAKKKLVDDLSQTNEAPRLKSTLSASNLFAGKDILGHIAEFCNELKKMATRAREREIDEKMMIKQESQLGEKKIGVTVNEDSQNILSELNVKSKDRKPLLEMDREKYDGMDKGSMKNIRRNKRVDDIQNIPVSLNLANVKNKGEGPLLQIQTNPPSPQCFSATRTATEVTHSRALKSRAMETGILQEVNGNKEMFEETEDKGRSFSIVDGREARAVDIFWFLKPCTQSS